MKQQDESLSLLLDDHSDAPVDAVLDQVLADVNLQYRLRRYRMIGDVMRNELPQAIDTGFHQGVMARIRQQEMAADKTDWPADKVRSGATSLAQRTWFKPFAGLAVAASVALVTIALWQQAPQGVQSPDSQASVDEQKIQQLARLQIAGGAVPVSSRVQQGLRWKLENESPVMQQKLNAYLVSHTEYSSSMQGLIPQARAAGFDAQ